MPRRARQSAAKAQQREGPNAGDSGAVLTVPEVPATFDPDEYPGGEGSANPQRFLGPVHRFNRSACQRT